MSIFNKSTLKNENNTKIAEENTPMWKNNADNKRELTTNSQISTFFHITDALSVPFGAVLTDEGREVYTVYTSCADLSAFTYYVVSYSCRTPHAYHFTDEECASGQIKRFSLPKTETIKYSF